VNWNSERMTCDDVRAAIADSVIAGSALSAAIETHVAGCDACRTYREECRRLWSDLGELPVPAPRPDARERLENAIGGSSRRTAPSWMRGLLIAAGFVLAMALGYGVASWRGSQRDATQQYLLLLYDTDATSHMSPADMSTIMREYSVWARGLRSRGELVRGDKLADTTIAWIGGEVAAVGGERVGGFFLIRAGSADEARAIASECPHVKHGGRLELRAIDKT
jgi:hypothetical protein